LKIQSLLDMEALRSLSCFFRVCRYLCVITKQKHLIIEDAVLTATGINHNVLGTWGQRIAEAMVYGEMSAVARLVIKHWVRRVLTAIDIANQWCVSRGLLRDRMDRRKMPCCKAHVEVCYRRCFYGIWIGSKNTVAWYSVLLDKNSLALFRQLAAFFFQAVLTQHSWYVSDDDTAFPVRGCSNFFQNDCV